MSTEYASRDMTNESSFLADEPVTPPLLAQISLPSAEPRYLSEFSPGVDITGCIEMAKSLHLPLQPQGLNVARVMNSKREDGKPRYSRVVIQIPRRGTKTTSVQMVSLDRCFNTENYKVVQTAQSHALARLVFLDMATSLEANYPDEDTRPFTVRYSNGQESIRWKNGSSWRVVAPKAGAFRSQAADLLWFDEAGEYDVSQTQDLVEGALPLLDTRPYGQVVISGTPGKTRAGMLWDFLGHARKGKARHGIVDYSMAPEADPADESTWHAVHPGLSYGLTDLEVIRERFDTMSLASFMREYLCADPPASSVSALDPELWEATTVPDPLPIPATGVTVAYACAMDDASAAVCAAWMTDTGPVVQVLDHRAGIDWVAPYLVKALRDNPRLPVKFDRIGSNVNVYTALQRLARGSLPTVEAVGMQQHAAGVSALLSGLANKTLTHAADPSLDGAAKGATFRYSNDSRLFSRRHSREDICPLEASALALYGATGTKVRERIQIVPRTL